jgi:hypothetical protein
MSEQRTVHVEILQKTKVNGTWFTVGQKDAYMTPFEARISVRDKAARIIAPAADAAPATAPATETAPARKTAAKKAARKAPAKSARKRKGTS